MELTIPFSRLDECVKFLSQNYKTHGYDYSTYHKHDKVIVKFYVNETYDLCVKYWRTFILES